MIILLGCYIGWIVFSNVIRKYIYSMVDSKVYEMGKSFTEHLINQTRGFECKVYSCKTKDGCKLQLFRIIYKGNDADHSNNVSLSPQSTIRYCPSAQQVEELLRESEQLSKKPVVVLQHGLLEAMTVFVLHEDSIAFQLAKKGFDVWLVNNRTSLFGQQHLVSRIHDEVEFWKFSIDEIAKYDMPAIIDFVRNATCQSKICWVGMSQGAGQLFAALSQTEYAHYKNYLSAIVGLSPACFLKKNPESTFLRLLIKTPSFIFGRREFMLIILIGQLLLPASFLAKGGEYALKLLNIQQKPLPNHPLKGEWFKNIPLGCTSVNNVVHWLRMLNIGGCLRKFNGIEKYPIDEMLDRWREVYHSNLSHQQQDKKQQEYVPPLFVFLGGKDNVIDYEESIKHFGCCDSVLVTDETGEHPPKNISTCPGSCPVSNNVRCKILFDPEYGHTDFLWAEPDAKHQRHYDKVIQFLEEHVQ
ncbi:lipase/esterase [Naegleria gruberi]|uniref:Lipase/esterase n=1 Tax=Naegleria gruberi TaxID=5762 RepID=D2VDQ6_NAEGR|nr:lipase/esterase [Naegleria gruberi]EFC44938.1 lipase/esterase [Naegleria gruberi]|eukprot:XP_002677682.1 lipase/esterase [Naegleria gruberi strain NEG-M]